MLKKDKQIITKSVDGLLQTLTNYHPDADPQIAYNLVTQPIEYTLDIIEKQIADLDARALVATDGQIETYKRAKVILAINYLKMGAMLKRESEAFIEFLAAQGINVDEEAIAEVEAALEDEEATQEAEQKEFEAQNQLALERDDDTEAEVLVVDSPAEPVVEEEAS